MFARLLIALAFVPALAHADITNGSCAPDQKATVTTQHTIVLNGKTIAYTATAGFEEVQSADGSAQACIFYTAYTVAGPNRPVMFAFNGGPGSASLWLHLGLMGPKRVDLGPDGLQLPRGTGLVDNAYSPIDVTDIVMIDPVATGFSHTEAGAGTDKFFGVKNDYISVASFVRNYVTLNSRWNSPKYVLGESYGGIRGPLLTQYLQDEYGIAIDGLIMVSPAMSGTSLNFGQVDNNTPYWTFFPNFATTAWYHQRLSPAAEALSVDQVYKRAQAFASLKLRDALDMGSLISNQTLSDVADKIVAFTGLDKQVVLAAGLRVDDGTFFTQVLRAKGLTVGRFDSRFTGNTATGGANYDPSDVLTGYPFTAGINDYLRGDLQWPLTSPYTTSAEVGTWPGGDSNESILPAISGALNHNPHLRVMITSGYFDLACPMGTVDYELTQLPDAADLRSRISRKLYFAGHMSYINPTELAKMKADIAAFVNGN